MMEIRDSRGRKVSLLNDEVPRLSTLHHYSGNDKTLPPLHYQQSQYSSRQSSASDRSTRSPPLHTPSLSRSDSSDSGNALHQPPSPPTPLSSSFEPLRHALPKRLKSQNHLDLPGIDTLPRRPSLHNSNPSPSSAAAAAKLSGRASRSSMDFPQGSLGAGVSDYPLPVSNSLIPGLSSFDPLLPAAPLSAQQPLPAAFDPTVAAPNHPQPATTQQQQQGQSQVYQAPVTQQRSQKKNSYPCPLSKQFNCAEYFTTSGHAARHAKKHTGKKDAICPECGKGFTRKDNMEQHRRTHNNGRNGTHHNSTSSASSNNTASSASSSSSAATKTVPKAADSDETKARKKVQQQRKTRPSSISTPAPGIQAQSQNNNMSMSRPTTATSAVPPVIDLLDPVLRDPNAIGFSPTSVDFGVYPFGNAGMTLDNGISGMSHFQAPHAPMRTSGSGSASASRSRHERRSSDGMSMARPQRGPTAPSLAPKLEALALVAEDVRRRDSDSDRSD